VDDRLSESERKLLLQMARKAIYDAVQGNPILPLDSRDLPAILRTDGASFVTLTIRGELRGCIGALEAYQSLAEDVREHAVGAALQDYRFPPVTLGELGELEIEISRLTPSQPLQYHNPDDLLARLRPGVDGIILRDGPRRATFLPQVWEKLPDPADFLSHLCTKMGASPDLWRNKILKVFTYQVEEFREEQVIQ